MKVLILCTGNSCRSQMAEGFLKSIGKDLEVFSAGTKPTGRINEKAIQVMKEVNIDISMNTSDSVEKYLNQEWDYVITVCDGAKEDCPFFSGKVENRLHFGFSDPSEFIGSEEEIMEEFRRVRLQIKNKFFSFYLSEIVGIDMPTCECSCSDCSSDCNS